MEIRAQWSTAYKNALPDSAFLYIEAGGEKDEDGKTTPRSLRHLPYKDKNGKIDLPHLRNAISRLGQEGTGEGWLSDDLRKSLLAKAKRLLRRHSPKEKAMSENLGSEKAASFNELLSELVHAWDVESGYISEEASGYGFVVDAGDGFVILYDYERYWKVGYSAGDDGDFAFAEKDTWVEMRQVWTERSADGERELILQEVEGVVDDTKSVGDSVSEPVGKDEQEVDPSKGLSSDGVNGSGGEVEESVCGTYTGRPVRSLGQNRIGEYLILWGDETRKDFYETFFTPDTEETTVIFDAVGRVPILYHHAMNDTVRTSVVGLIDVMVPDEVGLWVEGELDKANEYRKDVQFLLANEALFWSSATLPGAARAASNGEITRWPVVEGSLTPQPAEYRMVVRPIQQVRANYRSAGLDFPNQEPESTDKNDVLALEIELEKLELLDI